MNDGLTGPGEGQIARRWGLIRGGGHGSRFFVGQDFKRHLLRECLN